MPFGSSPAFRNRGVPGCRPFRDKVAPYSYRLSPLGFQLSDLAACGELRTLRNLAITDDESCGALLTPLLPNVQDDGLFSPRLTAFSG